MNSRERVLTALRHKEPDRIPIDFGAMRSTGIAAPAYKKLKHHLGIPGPTRIYDLFQWLAEPGLEVMRALGADVIQLPRFNSSFGIRLENWKAWSDPAGEEYVVPGNFDPVQRNDGGLEIRDRNKPDRILAHMTTGGHWFNPAYFPLAGAENRRDIDDFDWEGCVISDEEVQVLQKKAKQLHRETDFAILGEFGANVFEGGHFDFGYRKFMELLLLDKDLALLYMEKKADNWIESLKKYLPAVRDFIHVIQVGDDLGMQQGTQISLEMYREMIKPFHKKIYRFIKENSDLYVFLHSCGSIYDFIPDLIEIGVDIINPVQISAEKMEPERLKKEFGKDLVFWGGGIDTQGTFTHGTLADIRRETEENIKIFAPGGGFVFTQVHNIQSEVPPEKIVTLYKTARERGRYPF
jgi:uroporphyrinogen decarboxylase